MRGQVYWPGRFVLLPFLKFLKYRAKYIRAFIFELVKFTSLNINARMFFAFRWGFSLPPLSRMKLPTNVRAFIFWLVNTLTFVDMALRRLRTGQGGGSKPVKKSKNIRAFIFELVFFTNPNINARKFLLFSAGFASSPFPGSQSS